MEFTKWHEGERQWVNIDESGQALIGVGFDMNKPFAKKELENMGVSHKSLMARCTRLHPRQINALFEKQTNTAVAKATKWIRNFHDFTDPIKVAIAYFCFVAPVNKFAKVAEALEKEKFEDAANALERTKWFKGSGNKGQNIAKVLRTGELKGIA